MIDCNLTISPQAFGAASAAAAAQGITLSAYIESLILARAIPELLGLLGLDAPEGTP